MSNHWGILCIDCCDKHTFDSSNHMIEAMENLCKHAAAIAALAPLLRDESEVELKLHGCGDIDAHWFAKHHTHKLEPVDEYGRTITEYRRERAAKQFNSGAATK